MTTIITVKGMVQGKQALAFLSPSDIGREIVLESGGINWAWYCHVIIDSDGFATVTKEYRLHKFDFSQGANLHPDCVGNYQIVENTLDESRTDGRIAFGIIKDNLYFPFRNPIPRWDVGKH